MPAILRGEGDLLRASPEHPGTLIQDRLNTAGLSTEARGHAGARKPRTRLEYKCLRLLCSPARHGMQEVAGSARPAQFPKMSVEQRVQFGAGVSHGVFNVRRAGEKRDFVTELRKFDTFRAALGWKGDRVQVNVHKITIEGTLDKKWVAKLN